SPRPRSPSVIDQPRVAGAEAGRVARTGVPARAGRVVVADLGEGDPAASGRQDVTAVVDVHGGEADDRRRPVVAVADRAPGDRDDVVVDPVRSEEHTSEL